MRRKVIRKVIFVKACQRTRNLTRKQALEAVETWGLLCGRLLYAVTFSCNNHIQNGRTCVVVESESELLPRLVGGVLVVEYRLPNKWLLRLVVCFVVGFCMQ